MTMQVSISTSGGMVTAQLKLPRRWVIAAVLAIGSFFSYVGRTELKFQEVKQALANCQKIKTPSSPAAGQP